MTNRRRVYSAAEAAVEGASGAAEELRATLCLHARTRVGDSEGRNALRFWLRTALGGAKPPTCDYAFLSGDTCYAPAEGEPSAEQVAAIVAKKMAEVLKGARRGLKRRHHGRVMSDADASLVATELVSGVGRAPEPELSREELDLLRDLRDDAFLRPMDLGGGDGTSHSWRLGKLSKMGLVEKKKHHAIHCWFGSEVDGKQVTKCTCRGSCTYRRAEPGAKLVASLKRRARAEA